MRVKSYILYILKYKRYTLIKAKTNVLYVLKRKRYFLIKIKIYIRYVRLLINSLI